MKLLLLIKKQKSIFLEVNCFLSFSFIHHLSIIGHITLKWNKRLVQDKNSSNNNRRTDKKTSNQMHVISFSVHTHGQGIFHGPHSCKFQLWD